MTTRDGSPDRNTLPNIDLLSESRDQTGPLKIIQDTKLKNVNRLVIGHLNINSLRNKFDALQMLIKDNIDIFVITESKLDDSFPSKQFAINGYIQFRADRDADGGEVLIYVREDIPCIEINCHKLENTSREPFWKLI